MNPYRLHPTLARDTFAVGHMRLCELRLLDDRRFPWLILVPRLAGALELHDLPAETQGQLIAESSTIAPLLLDLFEGDKINCGALGNQVSQLHWHLIVRRHHDVAWPASPWGFGTRIPYPRGEGEATVAQLRSALPLFAD